MGQVILGPAQIRLETWIRRKDKTETKLRCNFKIDPRNYAAESKLIETN